MTSLFEHELIINGWKSLEAKTKDKKENSCWVSPDGKWYNVPFAEHQTFAFYVLKELKPPVGYKEELNQIDKAGDLLSEMGWILVHDDVAFGTIIHNSENMTRQQFNVLYEHFKETILFRGWTIKSLWKERSRYGRRKNDG